MPGAGSAAARRGCRPSRRRRRCPPLRRDVSTRPTRAACSRVAQPERRAPDRHALLLRRRASRSPAPRSGTRRSPPPGRSAWIAPMRAPERSLNMASFAAERDGALRSSARRRARPRPRASTTSARSSPPHAARRRSRTEDREQGRVHGVRIRATRGPGAATATTTAVTRITMPIRSSTMPIRKISRVVKRPVEYAIIVGGVPITSAKSTDDAIATTIDEQHRVHAQHARQRDRERARASPPSPCSRPRR